MRDVQNLQVLQSTSAVQKNQGARAFSQVWMAPVDWREALPVHAASVKAGEQASPLCAYGGGVEKGHRLKRQTGVPIMLYPGGGL